MNIASESKLSLSLPVPQEVIPSLHQVLILKERREKKIMAKYISDYSEMC